MALRSAPQFKRRAFAKWKAEKAQDGIKRTVKKLSVFLFKCVRRVVSFFEWISANKKAL